MKGFPSICFLDNLMFKDVCCAQHEGTSLRSSLFTLPKAYFGSSFVKPEQSLPISSLSVPSFRLALHSSGIWRHLDYKTGTRVAAQTPFLVDLNKDKHTYLPQELQKVGE